MTNNMNNKQKGSIILASLASIAVAGSVMAGATYALFTSESKTNIAVTSGTVDVTATISDFTTYTGDDLTGDATTDATKIKKSTEYSLENGEFKNGGTASLTDNTLTLEYMTPGDKVTFTIKVENKSTVSVKYRTKVSLSDDTGLYSGLELKIGEYTDVAISDWEALAVNSEAINLECEVSLPSTKGNAYQGKSCKLIFAVEAVQGNAYTANPSNVTSVESIQTAIESGASELVVSEDFTADVDCFGTVGKDLAAFHFSNKEYPNMAKTITISGKATVVSNQMAIWAQYGANIVVDSGTYDNRDGLNGCELIYANNDCTITINGGIFMSNPNGELFNISNQPVGDGPTQGGGGTIIIKGGLYNKPLRPTEGWQRQDEYNSETGIGIKIADGYEAKEELIDGETWYRVVKSTTI